MASTKSCADRAILKMFGFRSMGRQLECSPGHFLLSPPHRPAFWPSLASHPLCRKKSSKTDQFISVSRYISGSIRQMSSCRPSGCYNWPVTTGWVYRITRQFAENVSFVWCAFAYLLPKVALIFHAKKAMSFIHSVYILNATHFRGAKATKRLKSYDLFRRSDSSTIAHSQSLKKPVCIHIIKRSLGFLSIHF